MNNKKRRKFLALFLVWKHRYISEQNFVFILSVIVGILAGIGTLTLKNFTHLIQELLNSKYIVNYNKSYYFIFPIIGLFLVYLIKKWILKKNENQGITTTLYDISQKNGIMERNKMWSSLILAPITVGFGGSVGLQGPAVSTGAAIGSNIAQLFHMHHKTRLLIIGCACAGAMSSMFKAPVAAVIFAVEVFSFEMAFTSLIPLLLASISSVLTSYFFLGKDVLFRYRIDDLFNTDNIGLYIIFAIITAIASIYFSKIYFWITSFFNQFKTLEKRLLIGAVSIGIILYLIPPLYGEGYNIINNLLNGNPKAALESSIFYNHSDDIWSTISMLTTLIIFKAIAMTISFAAGGVGGIFVPTLVMGSSLGYVYSQIINHLGLEFEISSSNFTLIGMTGLMAGVLHAPLTAIFLIAEISGGYNLFIPLMLVSAISFAITRYFIPSSIYAIELAKKGHLETQNKNSNLLKSIELSEIIETNFIPIYEQMNLKDLLINAISKSNRNIFPVVNKENIFLGIVLLDDIKSIMFDKKLYYRIKVKELMKKAPKIIDQEKDNIADIVNKFQDRNTWILPVVSNGIYTGFISKSKLLNYYRIKLIREII